MSSAQCTTPSAPITDDAAHRAPDRRAGLGALGDAATVLDVGAGTGSYEPSDRTSPRWSRRRSCVRNVPQAQPRAWLPPRRAFRSRTSPSTPRWLLPPSITGGPRLPACARCSAWLAAWWCSRATPVTGAGAAGSGSRAITSPRSPLPVSASLPSWPALSVPGWSRYSFRGTALTASSRPTGADRGVPGRERPSRNIGVGECRSGRRAEGGAQPLSRPRIRSMGRTQPQPPRPRGGRAWPSPAHRLSPPNSCGPDGAR